MGWITSYLGKGATQAQVPTYPEPDADSRPGARPRRPPAELSAGTLLERCDAPADLSQSYTGPGNLPNAKCRPRLLDDDAGAILLPQSAADALDLSELFRLLERAMAVPVLDDLF